MLRSPLADFAECRTPMKQERFNIYLNTLLHSALPIYCVDLTGRNWKWLLYRSRVSAEGYIAITPVPLRKWSIYGEGRRKTKNEQNWYSRLHRRSIWSYRRCQTLQVYFPLTSKHEVLLHVNILSPLKRNKIDLLQRNSLPKKGVKNQFHTSATVLHSANPVQLTG